ncbi:PQQ-binding-like beta-propeller repeat protein [Planctomyces sp. SH-PL14]|uniref:outer membrane protein assembly factor BamB family protein n=1 Tax=Planctomyces sp. SH-PL14 TaxID=1632864 RepID=UPI00078B51FE|nr:PQQ-binding-like beta-propeller repeat protein [Planctomyces sp. SH-PL14]AMV19752.1 outer membrane biogenesis protein BamB [Planctomyces sp. SH-PL14]
MSDIPSPTPSPVAGTPVAQPAARPPRGILRTLFLIAFYGLLTIFVGAVLVAWFPIEGAVAGIGAIPYLIAQSSFVALLGTTVLWLLAFSRLSGGVRAAGIALIVIPVVAFVASVRDLEFTADMQIQPVFRWQKLQTEVVDEYRRQTAKPAGETVAVTEPVAAIVAPEDMPAYRGVHRDGIVIGPAVRENWREVPPKELWKHPVGEGYSSFVVVGDRLVTMEQRTEGEAVVCYSARSGGELWVHQTKALFDEAQGGPGPRATPEIDGEHVYALGATGELHCLKLGSGEVVWSKNVLGMTGVQNAQWGMTSSPLVVDNQLVVNIGGANGNGLLSFDKLSGNLLWKTSGAGGTGSSGAAASAAGEESKKTADAGEDVAAAGSAMAGYSSPQVTELDGVRQILNFDGTALRGHDIQDGHVLWTYDFRNPPGVNVAQPVQLKDGSLIVSASYGLGTVRLKMTQVDGKWTVTSVWPKPSYDLKAKMASMILHDGYLYGLDEGILVCFDPETGKRTWKGGRYGHGQLLATGDRIVVLSEKGEVILIHPNPKKLEELARFQALPADVKTWNPPAMSRGVLYVRNHHWMAAYDIAAEASRETALNR